MSKTELLFPHESIRNTQDKLINDIQQAIQKKQHLLIHAPTGIGKTAAILSAVLTETLDKNVNIFFLTPRHTQHRIVIDTIRNINKKHNKNIECIDLIGKKWMCAVDGASLLSSAEFYEYCKDVVKNETCDFYNNFKSKQKAQERNLLMQELLTLNPLHVEELTSISKKKLFCPYEISAELGKKAKVIIADYHHILNPSIRELLLKRTDKLLSSSIIIFDEAHNIVDKSRDLLTNKLSTIMLDLAIKEAHDVKASSYTTGILSDIKKLLESLASQIPIHENEKLLPKKEFTFEDYKEFKDNLFAIAEEVKEVKKRSTLASIANFLEAWLGQDEGFTRIIKKGFSKTGKPFAALEYNCLDPSLITKTIIHDSYLTIAMSGTLTPTSMYKDLLGYEQVTQLEYDSPFPKENQLNLIIPGTTTKFTARSEEMYEKIARYCSILTNNIPGNSLLFFPSYQLRDEIYNYMQNIVKKTTLLEHQNLSKEEKNQLLEKFKQYKQQGAILLAAASGNFGEGIDLLGDLLKAVIVIGIPLQKPDLTTQELIKYYDKRFGKGWDYGYIYPAIITTLQNAGRCIRSETDKGVIIFLDERYTWQSYFRCFPKDKHFRVTKEPLKLINEFFQNKDNKED